MEENEETEFCDESSVLLKVAGLYASHLLSDIILVVGENRYPAHRVILSASSEVFQCMLMNPQWTECNKSIINLVEDQKCTEVFPQFLKYLYTGQVKISIESAMPLLSLADKYNIKDLIVLCRDYMTKSVALAGTRGFLISWLQYTLSFDYHQQLSNDLKNFLRLNIETVGYTKDFIDIDPNNLCILLQQNDLVIKNEAKLFDIVVHYLMLKKEQVEQEESLSDEDKQSHMKSLIEGICCYIRYPMMTVQELATIPLMQITSFCKEFFCDKMALGMNFHANPEISPKNDYLQYTPRLYTSDNFCLEMIIPEIHKVENYKTFGACMFSLEDFPYTDSADENTIQWEIDFFPRGIRYNRAQLINIYSLQTTQGRIEVPESILRTVRVRCTCKSVQQEMRFKIAVLISGSQNNIIHIKTLHTRTSYFSRETRVINFDNLIPFEELDTDNSIYLIGKNRDNIRIHVIILPFPQSITQDSPQFEFK